MIRPENPYAFPSPDDGRPSDGYGMTLRDWFAGQAISNPNLLALKREVAADYAYRMADAMLAERAKGGAA